MSALKFEGLKRPHKNSDALLVIMGVTCSIVVVGLAGRTSSVFTASHLDSSFRSRQSGDVLDQSPDLATALSRLKRSHGKYCDQAVSVFESRFRF
jgi:hypothetical protein